MRRDYKAEAMLLITTLLWGGSFTAIKSGLEGISPMLIVGLRFIPAAGLAWPILAGRKRGIFSKRAWMWGLIIGLGMLAGYGGQTVGLKYTSVARSALITYSFALYVPFLQFLILKRRPDWGNLAGLLVVFWGLALITVPPETAFSWREISPLAVLRSAKVLASGGMNRGDLFTLGGALGYALYVVLLDRASRECHPGAVTVIQMLVCGVLALLLAPLVETPKVVFSPGVAASMIYLILFASVLALALMNWYQRRLSPLRAVLIYAVEPVFAAAVGWMFFRDGMSLPEILGGVLIIGGILVSDLWNYLVALLPKRRFKRSG